MEEIEKWFPGLKNPSLIRLTAAIVAYGKTDVDDNESLLHDRTKIGPKTYGGNYHSIDTKKLTTAPMFAIESVANIINLIQS